MRQWSKFRSQLLALVAVLSALAGPASRPGNTQDRGDEDVWQWAQTQGTVDAYETYLRRFPLGKYTRDAYRCAVVLAAREQAPDIDIINPGACESAPGAGPVTGTAAGAIGDAPLGARPVTGTATGAGGDLSGAGAVTETPATGPGSIY